MLSALPLSVREFSAQESVPPASLPLSEPQLAASRASLRARSLVPPASPLFLGVRRATTGHASCPRPSPAESPSSLLWLDAWLAHPCSRFFHRLTCTLGPTCWCQISWLREECRNCQNSSNRRSGADGVLCPFRTCSSRIIKLQIPDVDNPRKLAQPREKIQHVKIRPVRLHFKRHLVVIFLRHDVLRRQLSQLHVRRSRCPLHLPDKLVHFFFFRHDCLQRVQLLVQRVHLLLQLSVPLPVNLKLNHFLV